jgi:hypothetical protein
MPNSGLKHIDVGSELTKTEWESEESHELVHGTSFPSSPVERQLFYRDDEHKWYIYNGSEWVWLGGGGGGMQVHGNEYHDPDFAEVSHTHAQLHTQGTDTALGTLGTKNPPVDADKPIYRDSQDFDNLKTSTWSQIKAFFKTYFDTVYSALGHTHSDLSPAHKDATTGVHGVGAGTIAKVADIAVDTNLSAAAQDAIAKRHTQNTDKVIVDADNDTKIQVEKSADEDKIHMDVKGVEAFLLEDTGILTLAKQSAARVYQGSDKSVPDQTYTIMNLNTENFDIQNEFNTATYRYTATKAGLYLVVGMITYTDMTDQSAGYVVIRKNGVDYLAVLARQSASSAGYLSPIGLDIAQLAVGDYLELFAWQNKGSNANAKGGSDRTFLAVFKVA